VAPALVIAALTIPTTAEGLVIFAPPRPFPVGGQPASVAIGDLGDGRADLAVGGDDVAVLLGDGAGEFGSTTHFAAGGTSYGSRSPTSIGMAGSTRSAPRRRLMLSLCFLGTGEGGQSR